MSMLPLLCVRFDDRLNPQERRDLHDKISKMKGVLSASFNEKTNTCMVTHQNGLLNFTLPQTPGVKSVVPMF